MTKVRKPTQLLRRILTQEIDVVLDEETDVNVEAYRRVQIFVPESPQVFIAIDDPTPLSAGPDRTYKVPAVSPNVTLEFVLQPHQVIYGAVGVAFAVLGVLVEYKEE